MFRLLQHLALTTFLALFSTQASALFIQPDWLDPTEPGVGTNRYAYSGNDPINKLDPSGNNFIDTFLEDFSDLFRNSDQREEINIERYNRTILAREELQGLFDDGLVSQSYFNYYSDVLDGRLERYSDNLGRSKSSIAAQTILGAGDLASLGGKKIANDALEGASSMVSKTKTTSASTLRQESVRLTASQANDLANWLGFKKVKPASSPVRSTHGQPLFQKGNRFISPDVDGHNGGTWKVFDRSGKRVGTYNYDLSVRVGD